MSATDEPDALDPRLRAILDRMPVEPGVYLMKDKKGKIIYVGKARSLRARVRSYFSRSSSDNRAFIPLLARLLGDIETVVVENEKEALLLENNLIKQHQPRFNVKLVDDKSYIVLRLDPHATYPRLEVTRRIGSDGARYFGPYHSATSCRQTLHVVNRHFKLRTCSDQVLASRKRPCLQFQIKRCDAPCVFSVPAELYAEQVRDVTLFLEGKDQELVARLRGRMKDAAGRQEYEVAASVRDQIGSLEKTLTEQHVVSEAQRDQDVFGFFREGASVEIAVLHVRLGKLLGRRTFSFGGQEFPDEEIVSSFVSLYYDLGSYIPDEVLLPCSIEDAETKSEWLRERRGSSGQKGRVRAVEVLCPQRGPRAKLLELAVKNAQASFVSRRDKTKDAEEALKKMQERLGLKRFPKRIECYDVSHIQGAATVASMVVFIDGEPAKAEYRRFKVRTATNDDFAAMYEVLSRRFRRALKPEPGEPISKWALPDLVVIDGGRGQLGTAMAALRDAGADLGLSGLDVIGLAKEREEPEAEAVGALQQAVAGEDGALQQEVSDGNAALQQGAGDGDAALQQASEKKLKSGTTGSTAAKKQRRTRHAGFHPRAAGDARTPDRVFLPRIKDAIPLRANTAELYVLSRIRDEAHRFAITYHRTLRKNRTLRSALADVPGVGTKRQRELLRRFGSVRKIREATVEELAQAPGMSRAAAEAVRRFFDADQAPAAGETGRTAPGEDAEGAAAAAFAEAQAGDATSGETADFEVMPANGGGEGVVAASHKKRRGHSQVKSIDAEDVVEDAAFAELLELADENETPMIGAVAGDPAVPETTGGSDDNAGPGST